MVGAWLVTGASKGLGRSIAKELAASGKSVIALARESIDLGVVGAELASLNPDSITISCDLADRADIASATATIMARFSHIDGIVHNAGVILPIKPMLEVERADWARSIQVNLIGVQDLTRRIAPHLGGESRTRITCISSGASKNPIHSWSAYCVAKAGLDMWSSCMAEEGAPHNISSISIAPGIVDTGMQKDIRDSSPDEFPMHQKFCDFYENDELNNPDEVASRLMPIILDQSMEMSGQRLDIRDM